MRLVGGHEEAETAAGGGVGGGFADWELLELRFGDFAIGGEGACEGEAWSGEGEEREEAEDEEEAERSGGLELSDGFGDEAIVRAGRAQVHGCGCLG